MRLIIIYNTRSGRKQKRIRSRIDVFFRSQKVLYEIINYDRCNWQHIKDVCTQDETTRIIVVGGDGTLRRVLEFLWQNNLLKHSVAFIPIGSGNIVAYSLKLPFDMRQAFGKAITGQPKQFDLGILNNKQAFFIAAGFGRLANLSVLTGRSLKRRYGILAYALRIPSVLFHGYSKENFEVNLYDNLSGKTQTIQTHSLMVVNHLNLSALQPRRSVLADDGKLDIFTLHNRNCLGLIRAVFEFYRSRGNSSVLQHIQTSSARAEFKGFNGHMHLDGDKCEYPNSPLEFKVLKGAVSLIV